MNDAERGASRPFCLPRTETFTVRGRFGDDYRVDLAAPEGAAPPDGWPLLLLLDGTGAFGTCVEAVRRMGRRSAATGVSPLVVAGIPGAADDDTAQRQRDFTTVRAGDAPGPDGTAADGSGGAPALLALIEEDVLPRIEARFDVDARRRSLFGHSLAGYFALWVMLHHPRTFSSYAAISPSIWWIPTALHGAVERARGSSARALVAIGAWEDELPPWQETAPDRDDVLARRRQRAMVPSARALAAELAAVLGPEAVRFALLEEEDHASIVSTAIPRALRLASGAPLI